MLHATFCAVVASTIRIAQVPVATLGAFLEACAGHPTGDLEDLAEFAGFSLSTAKRAVPTLESFGLVSRDGSGRYVATADGVRRGMDPEAREQVIRRGLLGYRPFEMLVEGLALGEDVDAAIRKALSLLDLPRSEAPKLRTLLRWGEDLRILESDNGRVKLLAELGTESVEAVGPLSPEDVESEARARLFNVRRLGRDANNYLDETDRSLLAEALLKHSRDPRASIDDSGQALEDFLREVADERRLAQEAGKRNGAGQLAEMLRTNGVIHNHHQKMVEAPATIRNAGGHRKDKKTLAPWELTPGGAFAAHAMTLTAIRSIHHFVKNGRQTI
jgi:DNA-binding IclR family transcriptional regulator